MTWTNLKFGKYQGKSLPQIVLIDPDYFYWAIENGVFKTGQLALEADDILYKSKNIKIPASQPPNSLVEYVFEYSSGKLADVKIVPKNQIAHSGSSGTHRNVTFDMSIPRQKAPYDKLGGKFITTAIKKYVFGNAATRLTKKKCEDFFDDPNNFI